MSLVGEMSLAELESAMSELETRWHTAIRERESPEDIAAIRRTYSGMEHELHRRGN